MSNVNTLPFYRGVSGFEPFVSLFQNAMSSPSRRSNNQAYDIEALEENRYAIRVAAVGFKQEELDVQIEDNLLTITGKKSSVEEEKPRQYLYRGVLNQDFEYQFRLAEHVEIKSASLAEGLLSIELQRELPDVQKPRSIPINGVQKQPLEQSEESGADGKSRGSTQAA